MNGLKAEISGAILSFVCGRFREPIAPEIAKEFAKEFLEKPVLMSNLIIMNDPLYMILSYFNACF